MKTTKLLFAVLSLASVLSLAGCDGGDPLAISASGPATARLDTGVDTQLAAAHEAEAAHAAALSKAAAAAGAVVTINATTPDTAARAGIAGEAGLIQTVAGTPTEADRLAAAERARVVAEGQRDAIAAQYAAATVTAKATADALAAAKSDLSFATAALVRSKAEAQAERQAEALAMQRKLDAATQQAKAEQRRLLTWIFFGGAALLSTLGILLIVFAAEVPIFGPKAGTGVLIAAAALAALGTAINIAQDFADAHPNFVGGCIIVALVALAGAVGLMVANHYHAVTVPAQLAAKVEADATSLWTKIKGFFVKAITWLKSLLPTLKADEVKIAAEVHRLLAKSPARTSVSVAPVAAIETPAA